MGRWAVGQMGRWADGKMVIGCGKNRRGLRWNFQIFLAGEIQNFIDIRQKPKFAI
jgi:hypothetical protein